MCIELLKYLHDEESECPSTDSQKLYIPNLKVDRRKFITGTFVAAGALGLATNSYASLLKHGDLGNIRVRYLSSNVSPKLESLASNPDNLEPENLIATIKRHNRNVEFELYIK